jgi:hypothetical protein
MTMVAYICAAFVRLEPFGNKAVIVLAVCPTVGQPVGTMLSETGGDTGSVLFRLSFEHALIRTALASTATHPPNDFPHILRFLGKELSS